VLFASVGGGNDEELFGLFAIDESVGNGLVVDDVDLDRVTDFESELVKLAPGDINPARVPGITPDLFAGHQV